MRIGVVAEFAVKEGQMDVFLKNCEELIALTHKEEGCFAYDLYEADDGSGDLVMLEIWESREALDKHLQSEHYLRIVPICGELQSTPAKVRFFNML